MTEPKHILATFDDALASLRNNVLMMSSLTERSLDRAITGLLQRDDEACAIAIADDEEIDQLEKQVDHDGIDLLLRFQPVASDLRRVVSAMKLSSKRRRTVPPAGTWARRRASGFAVTAPARCRCSRATRPRMFAATFACRKGRRPSSLR